MIQLDQARGINKALMKMVDYIVERSENSADRILGISHCNCRERAEDREGRHCKTDSGKGCSSFRYRRRQQYVCQ